MVTTVFYKSVWKKIQRIYYMGKNCEYRSYRRAFNMAMRNVGHKTPTLASHIRLKIKKKNNAIKIWQNKCDLRI